MTALASIRVAGFRSLKDVTLEPGRVTVLIGPNGSGKSNLLAVLRMVPLMRTQNLRRLVGEAGGASALLHYGPSHTREIGIRFEFEQEGARKAYGVRLGYAAGDTLIFLDETVELQASQATGFQVISLGAGHAESRLEEAANDPARKLARDVRWCLSKVNFFHFHDTSVTAPLRQNARSEDVRFLRSNGSNLAAYLYALAHAEDEPQRKAWARVNGLVRQIAPFVRELAPSLVTPGTPATSTIRLDWIDERGEHFGPHHLSDGTLRAIALITALAQPTGSLPVFMSIDEPELGLHPAALQLLASLIRSVSHRCQVLLATQAPALLDHVEPEEIVVAERKDSATVLRRLEPEPLAEWLQDYSLSELYDKNVLGGRP
ncbi:MAG: AAA family ATPase [Myxococcaceae bacterium]